MTTYMNVMAAETYMTYMTVYMNVMAAVIICTAVLILSSKHFIVQKIQYHQIQSIIQLLQYEIICFRSVCKTAELSSSEHIL